MKKTVLPAALFALSAVGTAALAGPPAAKKTPAKPAAKPAETHCAVMGDKIKDASKASKSTFNGKTYYFCCAGCKPEFDKNPAKYAKAADAKATAATKPAAKKS
jgi:YHS domain-containing protein